MTPESVISGAALIASQNARHPNLQMEDVLLAIAIGLIIGALMILWDWWNDDS
jgi:hypothetical protein